MALPKNLTISPNLGHYQTFVDPKDRTHNVVMRYVKEQAPSYVYNFPPQLFKWTTDIPSFIQSALNVKHSDVWNEYSSICSYCKDSKANTLSAMFRVSIANDTMPSYETSGKGVLNSSAVWVPCAYPVLFDSLKRAAPEHAMPFPRLNPYKLYNGNNNYSDTEMQVLLELCGIQCKEKYMTAVRYNGDIYSIALRNNEICIQKNELCCPVSYDNKNKEKISCDQNHYVDGYYVNGRYVDGYYVKGRYVDGYYVKGRYVDGYYVKGYDVKGYDARDDELNVLYDFQKVLRYCFVNRFFQGADNSYACICFASGQHHLYCSYIDKNSSMLFDLLSNCNAKKKRAKSIDLSMYSRLDPCGVCMELLNWFSNVMNDKTKRDTFLKEIFFNNTISYNKRFTDDFRFNIWMISDMPYQDSMLAGVTLPYIQSMARPVGEAAPAAPAANISCYRYEWQRYIQQ